MMDDNFLTLLKATSKASVTRRDSFYASAIQNVASFQTPTINPLVAANNMQGDDSGSMAELLATYQQPQGQATQDTQLLNNSAGAVNTGFEGNSYSPFTY
jgi:hypothetical protein